MYYVIVHDSADNKTKVLGQFDNWVDAEDLYQNIPAVTTIDNAYITSKKPHYSWMRMNPRDAA